jgi:HD-like signal output (HDOD) protein
MGVILPHREALLAAPPASRRTGGSRRSRVITALRASWSRPSPLVFEVNRLLSCSPVDLGRVDAAVESDPEMAAALWAGCARLCGTADWEGASADEAMVLLGLDRFRFLISAYALHKEAAQRAPQALLNWFWSRSFRSACVCDRIGRWLGFFPAELPFLAGLYHDVGMLPLLSALRTGEAAAPQIRASLGRVDWESEFFGLDHCFAGGQLAARWAWPAALGDTLARHHGPASGEEETLLRVVSAAERIVASRQTPPVTADNPRSSGTRRTPVDVLEGFFPNLRGSGARNLGRAIQEEWSQYVLPAPDRFDTVVE